MALRKKETFRSRRREVRQYRKHFFVSGAVALVVLLLGVSVWYGARRPGVTIQSIAVTGGTTVSHEVVRSKVESILAGTYALLIPRHFSFLVPEKQIASAVNAIPRVHNAVVTRTSRNELAITFDEYMPYALWCDSVAVGTGTPASCIFVDDQGYAYADAPALLGETLLRFVIENKKPEIGVHVYDAQTLAHYRSFSDAITKNHQHRLRAITETKDGDLILHLSGDVNLLVDKEVSIQTVFENIESIFGSEEFKGKPLEDFEYIDLRFGNRVYVKARGAGEEGTTTTDGAVAPTTPATPEPEAVPVTPSIQAVSTSTTR